MTYSTAIIPGGTDIIETVAVAEALRCLVGDNQADQAEEVFKRYSQRGKEGELALLYADILLKAGRFGEAESLLEKELERNPGRFALVYRIGLIEELRGRNVSAFDIFRRAVSLSEMAEQKKEARLALARAGKMIKSEVFFKPDSFVIRIDGNKRPLNLNYNLEGQLRRKALLETLLGRIDPGAKTVLELEFDTGLVTRALFARGFKAEGAAAEIKDITQATGFDYMEMLRRSSPEAPNYHNLTLDEKRAARLPKYDVIALFPPSPRWYYDRGSAKAAAIIGALAQKARRQLFFHIPAAEDCQAGAEFARSLFNELNRTGALSSPPRLCFNCEAGGYFYQVSRQNSAFGTPFRPAPGPKATPEGGSKVIEVEVERCRSFNGFGYSEEAWNHLSAALEELLCNPGLFYEKSVLKKFYDRFQPKSRQVHLFGEEAQLMPPLNRGWTLLPWADTSESAAAPAGAPAFRAGGNQNYGPNSPLFGAHVMKRLLSAYTLIKKFGYLPEVFPDGYVEGYLLKDGPDYRFYVNEGQCRLAAIGHLGLEKIRVRLSPGFASVVDIGEIETWPQVRRGLYSEALAKKVFRYYFEEDGRRKAKALGLID